MDAAADQTTSPIKPGNGIASLPVSTTITDFKLPSNQPLRTRPSAHSLSPDYIAKYKQAYTLLRQLSDSDPRSHTQEANVYDVNGTQLEYQVHNSWFFLPWHRWNLYFHERILASLLKDDSFTLPFWSWDSPTGYTLPPLFNDGQIDDASRNPLHGSPVLVDLNYNFTEANRTPEAQLQVNNAIMCRQVVTGAKIPSLFFGGAYRRQGDEPSSGPGTAENILHGAVSVWIDDRANTNDSAMGSFFFKSAAARDHVFFSHHANLDRIWEMWKGLGDRRGDFSDPEYLDATFFFNDENAKRVRVRVGDALDTNKLGYGYETVDVPNEWTTASTTRTSTATAMNFGPGGGPAPVMAGPLLEKIKEIKDKYGKLKSGLKEFKERSSGTLEQKLSTLVKRPRKVRADDFDEEILVLEGVTVQSDKKIKFDVYINLLEKDEGKVGCEVPEYVGSFISVPPMRMKMGEGTRSARKSNFRMGIGDVLKELDIEDDDDFAITIVPRGSPSVPASIDNVRIEYE